ncbi:MAG TPA: transporter [Casimicrobiaceae bacterium]|nr:transporter [Casimicrobiaceae bacterium]
MLALAPAYRSDPSGLVYGYRFGTDASAELIHGDDVASVIESSSDEAASEFAWLHFDLSHVACEKWLHARLSLPDAFYAALSDGARTTHIEQADGSLVAVINDVLYDFAFEATHISTLWVCATPRLLITARRKPLRSIDRLRTCVRNGDRFRSTVALLVHLLRDQGDVLVGIVRKATSKVDDIEDSLLAGRLDTKRASLGELRRVLVRLGRLLAPEPPALFRLLNRPPNWMLEADVQDLRQATEEFAAVITDMSVLTERIKLVQEEVAAQVAEQNNRSLFLLTVFTVLALPINIIAGLFGMNVGGVPLAQHEHGFWIVVGIVTLLTIAGVWLVVRRRD